MAIPIQRKPTLEIIALLLIIALSTVLSAASLTRGDQWGDFAGYFLQAKGILAGDPAGAVTAIHQLNANSAIPPGPDAYPWAYPALVALVARFRGFDPLAIKAINLVFYAAFLVALYIFARKRLPALLALLVTAAFAYSPISTSLVDHLRSDVVFMFFFMAALAANDREGRGWNGLLWLAIMAAIFTRTLGFSLLLLPGWRLYDAWKRERSIAFDLAPFGVFLLALLGYYTLLPNGEGAYFSHFDLYNLETLAGNIGLTLITPKMFVSTLPADRIFYTLLCAGFVLGVWRSWRAEKAVVSLLASYLLIITLWPEPQGYRFFAPIMPLIVVYVMMGIVKLDFRQPIPKLIGALFLSILVLFSLPAMVSTATRTLGNERAISGPFDQRSGEVYRFIQKNTGANDLIHFAKPRALLFFTDHPAIRAEDCAGLSIADMALFADDLVGKGGIEEVDMLTCDGLSVEVVFENPRYRLYRVR